MTSPKPLVKKVESGKKSREALDREHAKTGRLYRAADIAAPGVGATAPVHSVGGDEGLLLDIPPYGAA